MSDKRKPKSKRGWVLSRVDFLTPLSVEECVAHLKAGHSPIRSMNLIVYTEGAFFSIGFDSIFGNGAGETAWLEGYLEPAENGLTRVRGQTKHTVSTFLVAVNTILFFIVSCSFLTLDSFSARLVFTGMVLALAAGLVAVERRRMNRLSSELVRWVNDRLNVSRG